MDLLPSLAETIAGLGLCTHILRGTGIGEFCLRRTVARHGVLNPYEMHGI